MAFAVRTEVNGVTKNPDGSIAIKYTEGDTPLPATWTGNSQVFGDAAALEAELLAAEARVSADLKLIAWAKGYKADPSLGAVFASTVSGKTSTLDLTGLVAPLSVG